MPSKPSLLERLPPPRQAPRPAQPARHPHPPFIAAYWGWCGYLKTLETFRIYDVVRQVRDTYVVGYTISAAVLAFHVIACTLFAWRKLPREMK